MKANKHSEYYLGKAYRFAITSALIRKRNLHFLKWRSLQFIRSTMASAMYHLSKQA